jgi:hypothetical protein
MSVLGVLAIAITINGSTPTFTAQDICVVNTRTTAKECKRTHSATFNLPPGRYQISVDGDMASTADVGARKTTTVILTNKKAR